MKNKFGKLTIIAFSGIIVIAMLVVFFLSFNIGISFAADSTTLKVITPISSCTVIDSPGEYILTADIMDSSAAVCLTIGADDITLDCKGHKISGVKALNSAGISVVGRKNITIKNCRVSNFDFGIQLNGLNDSIIENVTSEFNSEGLRVNGGLRNSISNSVFSSNDFGIRGIEVGPSNNVRNSILSNNAQAGISIEKSTGFTIRNNIFSQNPGAGINLRSSTDFLVSGNDLISNRFGIQLIDSSIGAIENNAIRFGSTGILLTSNSYFNALKSNRVLNNEIGLNSDLSGDNLIFNNFFNNTINALNDNINFWNITKTSGTNIVDGPFLGGNFWHDYTGQDLNGDGIGDTLLPYNSGGNIQIGGDFLPLVPLGMLRKILLVCVEPPSGLVSWWPGEGNANDIWDGNPGTLYGDTTFAPGAVGQAFSFDGMDDYVEVADSANLKPTDAITIEAWVKPNRTDFYRTIVSKFWYDGYYLRLRDGEIDFWGHGSLETDPNIVPVGSWSHIAGTYDATTAIANIYLNGQLVKSEQTCGPAPCPIVNVDFPLRIGAWPVTAELPFDGLIDEVEIYNRALSSSEIQAIYKAGSAGKCKVVDTDGDGIVDEIDTLALIFSNDFDDRPLGGTTYGTITERGGWSVSITELPNPAGIRFNISGAGTAPARVVTCNNNVETILDVAGESAVITCDSTTVTAELALDGVKVRQPPTGTLENAIEVTLSTGQTVTIGTPITASPDNIGSIVVEVVDEFDTVLGSGALEPGQIIDITPEGPRGEVIISNPGTTTISFTMDGTIITFAPGASFTDACPGISGFPDRQGCPVGDENFVELHVIDRTKTFCGGAGSCKNPIEGAEVRVFDRNNPEFQRFFTKNPTKIQYPEVFEVDIGRVGTCVTDINGKCIAGEETIGDYLVIVKHIDEETLETLDFIEKIRTITYTGRPKSPQDFQDTDGDGIGDLAFKDFQVIKIIQELKEPKKRFIAGSKTVITGSFLEVIHPQYVIWEENSTLYPFIFTSDSDWTVDVCVYVPEGYKVVEGECIQVFVANETKDVVFTVVEVGSPEPDVRVELLTKHKGKAKKIGLSIEGKRSQKYLEEKAKGKEKEKMEKLIVKI